MIFYLTFNDQPSGIYSSQVIEVVKFIKEELKTEIKLVAFISLRNFLTSKKKIKDELPDSLVVPMFPGVHRWRKNSFLLNVLCTFKKPKSIIARSVLAAQLAMQTNVKKLVYDGRGAIAAEWKEYEVITDLKMLNGISVLEKNAILNSSFRLSVSSQLINYWRTEYQYAGDKHVIIPCTLNKVFEKLEMNEELLLSSRKKLGLIETDVVFAYSGSVAGWQSFDLLFGFMKPYLLNGLNHKLLFLSEKDEKIVKLQKEFPGKVICQNVLPQEVPIYLIAADFGLLIREESITNKVAAPVKFAEYLACGLPVIISDHLGDYSRFVAENNCGKNYKQFKDTKRPSLSEKKNIRAIGLHHFTKKNFINAYQQLLT